MGDEQFNEGKGVGGPRQTNGKQAIPYLPVPQHLNCMPSLPLDPVPAYPSTSSHPLRFALSLLAYQAFLFSFPIYLLFLNTVLLHFSLIPLSSSFPSSRSPSLLSSSLFTPSPLFSFPCQFLLLVQQPLPRVLQPHTHTPSVQL